MKEDSPASADEMAGYSEETRGAITEPRRDGEGWIFTYGTKLSGVYEIRRLLGQGGMGQVFDAYDVELKRAVAVKVAWPDAPEGALLKEAQALAALTHTSLVRVYSYLEHEGIPFIVMERVQGVSLVDAIIDRAEAGESFNLAEVYSISLAVAGALKSVHQAGIAHRDVKPGNVMLCEEERFVLMDFGLFLPEFAMESQSLISGSPPYMAPESLANLTVAGQGKLVDIYGLGVMMYELLTGRLPREGVRIGSLKEAIAPVLPPSQFREGVPSPLEDLILSMLQTEPDARPASIEEVIRRLEAAKEGVSLKGSRPKRILVVDDNKEVANVLAYWVSRELGGRCEKFFAVNGEEAIEQIRAVRPDVMLLDMEMPIMNGLEVVMYMRGEKLGEDCHVIAVSAGAQDKDVSALKALGVVNVVMKDEHLRANLRASLEGLRDSDKSDSAAS